MSNRVMPLRGPKNKQTNTDEGFAGVEFPREKKAEKGTKEPQTTKESGKRTRKLSQ